jgi:hypothetical protein
MTELGQKNIVKRWKQSPVCRMFWKFNAVTDCSSGYDKIIEELTRQNAEQRELLTQFSESELHKYVPLYKRLIFDRLASRLH